MSAWHPLSRAVAPTHHQRQQPQPRLMLRQPQLQQLSPQQALGGLSQEAAAAEVVGATVLLVQDQ